MDEFLFTLLDHPQAYGLILICMATVYYLAGRRTATSLADPWMVQQAFSAFASSAVLFMWWIGSISLGMAIYHVAAMLLFFAIASYHPPRLLVRQRAMRKRWVFSPRQISRIQLGIFMMLVACQLVLWSVSGLPILLPSRLDANATGGGFGILTRLVAVFTTVLIFVTVVRIGRRTSTYSPYRDAAVMLTILLIQVISGSKSSIISTVLIFLTSEWLCRRLTARHHRLEFPRRYVVAALAVTTGLALVPFVIENLLYTSSTSTNPAVQFALRAVLSGDAYIFFLGNGYLSQIKGSPTLLLLSDFLGSFRIVSRDSLPMHPGLALTRELFPTSDAIAGPNMRLDLFGYLFGGWLPGLIFVCLAALLFRWMRSLVFRARGLTPILLAVYLFFNAHAVFIDPTLGMGTLLNALLALPFIAVTAAINAPRRRLRRAPGAGSVLPADYNRVSSASKSP